jgi:hypothetical protein
MPRYYVTVGPQSPEEHPGPPNPSPTWVVDAADEDAARDQAEVSYRRSHPGVGTLRLRLTRERSHA